MKRVRMKWSVVMFAMLIMAFVCMGCAHKSVKPTDFGCTWQQICQGIQEGHNPDTEKCEVIDEKVVWTKKGGHCDKHPDADECQF